MAATVRLPFARWGVVELVAGTVLGLGGAAACALLAEGRPWLWAPAALLLAVWLLLVNFFRDPERTTPQGPLLVVAPADGVVQDVTDVEEPSFLAGAASRIGIFLSPLDVHVNRMPMEGVVAHVDFRKGRMLAAYDPRAIEQNESAAVGLEVLGGRARILVRQVTGAVARRIVCPVRPGERYRAGQRYGMIKFGSRTEVWVPASLRVRWAVGVGDRVRAGETVLGTLEGPAA
jgi:phosphatidylserine decarboxylase